jgi:hypothetical protein
MEQYFYLHNMPNLEKVHIASLYIENDHFVWYQWLFERKNNHIISWSIFIDELISHYGDINNTIFFSQLIIIWEKLLVIEHIQQFQKLNLMVKKIPKDNSLDIFMQTLKDNIKHEVIIF